MKSNPLVDIFRIKDLRNRILFTILMLIIFRVGSFIPIPGLDRNAVLSYFSQGKTNEGVFDFLDFMVGGAFKNISIFMLGIMPYITTSIIMNLLTITFPKLKKISEEEGGKKKIQRYTRLGTIPVCIIQSFAAVSMATSIPNAVTLSTFHFTIMAILSVTAGTVFLMWMGEQITQRGIGNGASMIIFAGIVARMPEAFIQLFQAMRDPNSNLNPIFLFIVLGIFVFVIAMVIYEQQGQRKIPVYYAKRVIGRKIYGSQNTYLPFKINPSGVIPVIFAGAVLSFPAQILQGLASKVGWLQGILHQLNYESVTYNVLYGLFIIFFAYFYTQVTLNPMEISKNIRENGGSIPGIRSEKMEEYLAKILNRIILPGALFLAFIAIIPTLISVLFNFPRSFAYLMGGTSLLIIVGVDLDTMAQVEGHLRMHHHEGLVKKGKIRSRYL